MPGKRKKINAKKKKVSRDLWIAPRYSMKGPAGERAWENRLGGIPNSSRLLELADIALGIQKPNHDEKPESLLTHQTEKTEPYQNK
jgi:hypothetical protein